MKKTIYILIIIVVFLFLQKTNAQEYDPPVYTDSLLQTIYKPSTTIVVTDDQGFDNIFLGTDLAEPHLSENPNSALQYFTAININNTHYTDDGLYWQSSQPEFGNYYMRGDPLTAHDGNGNLYYMNMYGSNVQGALVMRSTDNGATWADPEIAISGVDKCWMAVDQTDGPYANYIYATMTAGRGNGNFARSKDEGATWQQTYTFSTQSVPGMMVAVGPDVLNGNDISGGCVYVVTNSGSATASTYTFYCSQDGGGSFSQKSSQNFAGYVGSFINGRHSVENMRTRPYPFITADNSSGDYRGRLYLVYASNSPAGNGNKPDIFCRYSDDQGESWSSAVRINDDSNTQNNHQWMPAIWCDLQSGRLYVKWQDTRRCQTSDSADVYASYSDDGGLTWATNQRLTTEKFKINCTTCGGDGTPRYQGDYDAIISNSATAMAVWSDYRDGRFDTYTAFFPDFAMRVLPDNYLAIQNETFDVNLEVPATKLYNQDVHFSVQNDPSANFTFSFPDGNILNVLPGSLPLTVSVNSTPLGDYEIKINSKGPNGTPVHERSLSISVVESNNITLLNRIGDITDYGALVLDGVAAKPLPSGTVKPLAINSAHEVRTDELPFIPDWQQGGNAVKHHHFYSENYDYSLNHQFEVKDTEPVVQDANFIATEPAVVKTKFISGDEGGEIEFKDPWRYYKDSQNNWLQSNQFIVYDSPCNLQNNSSQSYGGVFLDQGYADPSKPYYSVKADAQQTFSAHEQSITGYFLNWEGDNVDFQSPNNMETPVVFHDANAEARAVYKGHFVSDNTKATGHNNGRRVAKENNGNLHMVYEDNGKIWYSRSDNNGESWSKEELVYSDEDYIASNPCIACYNNRVYVAWAAYPEDPAYNNFLIMYDDQPVSGGGDWDGEVVTLLDSYGSNGESLDISVKKPRPSIDVVQKDVSGVATSVVLIAYDYYAGGYFMDFVRSDNNWSDPSIIPGENPSLNSDRYFSTDHKVTGFVYEDEGEIIFRTFEFLSNGDAFFNSPVTVSETLEDYDSYHNPNISYFNGCAYMVWEGLNTSTNLGELFYREYNPNSGNNTESALPPPNQVPYQSGSTNISSSQYNVIHPTVGTDYNADNSTVTTSIFYQKENTIYRQKFRNGYRLGFETWFGSGRYPSVVPSDLSGCVWTTEESVPYFLDSDYETPVQPTPIKPVNPNWGSLEFVIPGDENGGQDGKIILDLYNVTYGADTLNFNQKLKTDSGSISGSNVVLNMDLKVKYINVNNLPADQEIMFNLNYIDQPDTIYLTSLSFGELPENAGSDGERFFKVTTIVNLGNRSGYFDFKFGDRKPTVLRKYNTMEDESAQKGVSNFKIIPTVYKLHQNFPNPFNPVTHITVEIPESGETILSVYNVQGQKVRNLMSGSHPAGIYEVVFDGSGLASGLYFYRLKSKNFVQTKRMLLVK